MATAAITNLATNDKAEIVAPGHASEGASHTGDSAGGGALDASDDTMPVICSVGASVQRRWA
jgi:hypothetical protein